MVDNGPALTHALNWLAMWGSCIGQLLTVIPLVLMLVGGCLWIVANLVLGFFRSLW